LLGATGGPDSSIDSHALTSTRSTAGRVAARTAFWIAVALVFLVAAELTARVEDRLRQGVPLSAVPDHDRDLVLQDMHGIRGRPNGRYKKWRLNQFGFRNGDMSEQPAPGTIRLMALGASETFGLFESDGKEFPAQLETLLNRNGGRHEVINAAVPGLTLRGLITLWNGWAAGFRPRYVLVYPTPAFYLGEYAPRYPVLRPAKEAPPLPPLTPRLLDRARDRFDFPIFVQRWRVRRMLQAEDAAHEPSWFFRTIPAERLEQFEADLTELVRVIKASGASPILLTHALAVQAPLDADEQAALEGLRAIRPRATEPVLLAFEDAARQATLAVAAATGAGVVDVAGAMNGRKEWFAEDYLHFNDEGAAQIAQLIARYLQSQAS
jgi:hypothetical protein